MTQTAIAPKHRGRRILLITVASVLVVIGAALGAVLVVGGILVPAVYLQAWSPTYYQQFSDPRMQVVAHAVLAPSGHNMQPWIVELDKSDESVLTVYADASRLTPAVDPLARQTLVSQGTFLTYLQVAAKELGYSTSIELFPEGEYDETDLENSMGRLPVARITMTPNASAARRATLASRRTCR